MELLVKAAAAAMVGAVLVLVVRRSSPELALVVSLAACLLLVSLLLQLLTPVLDFLEALRQTAGLNETVLAPLLKTVAIGLIARVASMVCADAGENALGSFAELCGAVCAVYTALPLLNAVLELLETLMGG